MALKIGSCILEQINKMQEDKKDFGQNLIIPIRMPTISGEPPWTFTVSLGMPRFSQINYDGTITSFTMAEYFKWGKTDE